MACGERTRESLPRRCRIDGTLTELTISIITIPWFTWPITFAAPTLLLRQLRSAFLHTFHGFPLTFHRAFAIAFFKLAFSIAHLTFSLT